MMPSYPRRTARYNTKPDELIHVEDTNEVQANGKRLPAEQQYFYDIGKTTRLSAQEEQELAQDIEAGDSACIALAEYLEQHAARYRLSLEAVNPPIDLPTFIRALKDWKRIREMRSVTAVTASPQKVRYLSAILQTADAGVSALEMLDDENLLPFLHAIHFGNAARDHMVRANLPLVLHIAKNFKEKGLELDDLIAEGNAGLLRAVEGYERDKDTRFCSYAVWRIQETIQLALKAKSIVRIPGSQQELISAYEKAAASLQAAKGSACSFDEVAIHMELSPARRKVLERALLAQAQEQQPDQICEGASLPFRDDIKTPDAYLEELEEQQRELDQLHAALSAVEQRNPRQAHVLRLRFGIAEDPLTLKEIGDRFGITRERVRQIEADALKNIRLLMGA